MMLQAFHNSKKIKSKCVLQLEQHYDMDEIIKGTYWENSKGCAVGCTIHSVDHQTYETKLGIPVWLAHLEDYLFENLPNDQAKEFPIKFIKSIPVGFDNWTKIYHNLCVYLLTDIIKTENDSKVIKAVDNIITLHIQAAKGEIESNLSPAAEFTAGSAAWTAAGITFLGASSDTGTFLSVEDAAGVEVSIVAEAVKMIRINAGEGPGYVGWLQIRSGDLGTPVNQAAERVLILYLK